MSATRGIAETVTARHRSPPGERLGSRPIARVDDRAFNTLLFDAPRSSASRWPLTVIRNYSRSRQIFTDHRSRVAQDILLRSMWRSAAAGQIAAFKRHRRQRTRRNRSADDHGIVISGCERIQAWLRDYPAQIPINTVFVNWPDPRAIILLTTVSVFVPDRRRLPKPGPEGSPKSRARVRQAKDAIADRRVCRQRMCDPRDHGAEIAIVDVRDIGDRVAETVAPELVRKRMQTRKRCRSTRRQTTNLSKDL